MDYPKLPLPETKPPAAPESLPPGASLGVFECVYSTALAPEYLADVREDLALYADQGLVHPGYLLRLANWVLRENVLLGPWIHVASEIQHLATAEVDAPLSARARVLANYERKGHKFVELEVLALGRGEAPLAVIKHTAIYEPRRNQGAAP